MQKNFAGILIEEVLFRQQIDIMNWETEAQLQNRRLENICRKL